MKKKKAELNIALRVTDEEKAFVEKVGNSYGYNTSQMMKRALSFYLYGLQNEIVPMKLEVKIDGWPQVMK